MLLTVNAFRCFTDQLEGDKILDARNEENFHGLLVYKL